MKFKKLLLGGCIISLASLAGCATIKPKPDIQPKINKTTVEIGTNGYNIIGGNENSYIVKGFLYYYRSDEKEKYIYFDLIGQDGIFDGMKFESLRFDDDNLDGLVDEISLEGVIRNPTNKDFDIFIEELKQDGFKFDSITIAKKYITYEISYEKETGPKSKFNKAQKWLKDYQKMIGADKVHKEWEEKYKNN